MNHNPDLIPLQASHVTQTTVGHMKSDWSVQLNKTDKEILVLPKHYTEAEIFHIMDFAKKYELAALNIGITFQKNIQNDYLKGIIEKQRQIIEELGIANDTLSSALHTEMCRNEV